LEKQFCWNI